jgi:hypothetical protein
MPSSHLPQLALVNPRRHAIDTFLLASQDRADVRKGFTM